MIGGRFVLAQRQERAWIVVIGYHLAAVSSCRPFHRRDDLGLEESDSPAGAMAVDRL
jgi:hypothetical protein